MLESIIITAIVTAVACWAVLRKDTTKTPKCGCKDCKCRG